MKKFLLLMLTLVFAAVIAACGNNSEDASTEADTKDVKDATAGETTEGITTEITSPVEIDFWHAMSGDHEAALTEITDNFNESQENITVNLVNQGSYDDLSQKIMAAAKAKNLPAMSQAYEDWITEYLENDLVADLTPYVSDAKYGMDDEELNDIVEIFRESNTWDGKYYGMPFNKSTRIMFYNTDYFEEAGLEAPTTWEELRAAAEKLTMDKDGKKVVGLGLENSVTLEFNQWVEQAGGDFIDEESGEFKMNSPEGKEALDFVNGMIQDGVARTAGEDGYMSGPFTNGDVAIYIGSSAGIPYVAGPAEENGLNWSAAVLPAGKEAATPFAGTNVSVFNSAADEEKLAAWEFTKFLINTENTAFWASKTGYLPVRYSALESDEWVQYKEENPVYGIGEQQFDAGFYDPRIVGAYALKNAVAKELDKVLLGEMTVEEGLEAAEKAANAELGN
ncbi:ABC transporter substrate-binding protein [Rossellomorea vietnamensis]|uniref:ABC transporter substrate-binding protein n=1 Tax=Rossellomorea vietnamensis TaxID=218284 RepID=A0A5D4KBF1_9BACI|nr:ABC transporter substrate-binding protein [Rossellomorea vietnamensis]TYR73443.1 ABC transporter substrate-binding protein [Rossellomorea vietnamensis]